MIAINCLRQPWRKRLQERAEKSALKQLEKELKETAEKEREVLNGNLVTEHFNYFENVAIRLCTHRRRSFLPCR